MIESESESESEIEIEIERIRMRIDLRVCEGTAQGECTLKENA